MMGNGPSSDPLVSVVITTYDRPELCKRAVRSVREQTYSRIELIVVEDGSETGVGGWLETTCPNTVYVRHERNRGLAAARNTGLVESEGELVAYLDDDDEWKPNRIERQIEALRASKKRDDIGVVYCGLERRTRGGELISTGRPTNTGKLADSIRTEGASTLPSTFLFVRDALEDVGRFDERLPSSIDHDIWMSLAVNGYSAVAVDEALVITYVSRTDRAMTTDTIPRIYGVKSYVDKWQPTYIEWFGEEEGRRYAERYFANVIARLVYANVRSRSFFEFGQSICAIFSVCSRRRDGVRAVLWRVIAPTVASPLPRPLIEKLKGIRDRRVSLLGHGQS